MGQVSDFNQPGPLKPLSRDAAGHGGNPSGPEAHGLVVLAGAIKWWWDIDPSTGEERWGGPEHQAYVAWRNDVRSALVAAGWLTYAPHEAFKGPWSEAAQAVNDAAIRNAAAMVILSPPHCVTEGTDAEVQVARDARVPVLCWDAPSLRTPMNVYPDLAARAVEGLSGLRSA